MTLSRRLVLSEQDGYRRTHGPTGRQDGVLIEDTIAPANVRTFTVGQPHLERLLEARSEPQLQRRREGSIDRGRGVLLATIDR